MRRSKYLGWAAAVVTVAAGVLATGALATGAPASVRAHQASCPGFNGPKWTIPELGKTGTHWKVTARGVTCAYATRWGKKLLKTKYKGEAATKLKGPKHWHCLPSIPHGGGVPGNCMRGKKLFAWGPDAH